MSSKILAAVCLLPLVLGEDFVDWKENKQEKTVATRERKMYESVASSLDDCLGRADELEGPMVQFHQTYNVCTIYTKVLKDDALADSTDFALYTKSPDTGLEEDGMSTAGLIVTIILGILFSICLVFLALNCKEEEHSIAEQIENLEKKEMEVEEAVSEGWEKRSEAEEKEREMEVKEADETAQ